MTGILKRRFEEGSAPFLSSQRSDEDDVSGSDSGNSSDSLNPPAPPVLPGGKTPAARHTCTRHPYRRVMFGR